MRTLCLVLLFPIALVAQTSPSTSKPSTPASTQTAKPATPAPAPRTTPSTAKPATTPAMRPATPATTPRPSTAKPAAPAATAALTTDEQKTIYALGLVMQQSLAQFDLSPAELEIVKRAITDGTAGKPAIKLDEFGPKIDPLVRERRERLAVREKAASVAYLAKAATEAGVVKTDSGLIYRELSAGTGASPAASDTVRVHYRGTLVNGTEFDSSYGRNEPTEFRLNGVIPCWTEGVQRMKVGGKGRLVCPSSIAYGDNGSGPIPGGATLIFEIELLDIVK